MRTATLTMLLLAAGCAAPGPVPGVGPRIPAADPWVISGSASRGAVLAQTRCSGCHATGASDSSPMLAAPPFRSLSQRYPVADLQEALAEGLVTAHPAMPQIVMEEADIADLIAYLDSAGHSDTVGKRR
ncbi:c-type cytochrome [Brevundimonas sp.]|uniref:c-type cytochrome n=1 Tax=Brevundimonas sp. TaxID=1871086 RepID=UPI00286A3542|nr:c-type cytochrome [Brevundimonas sp.]